MILAPWLLLTIAVALFGAGFNLGLWIKRRDRRPDPGMRVSNSEYRFARRVLETQNLNWTEDQKLRRIIQILREERPE